MIYIKRHQVSVITLLVFMLMTGLVWAAIISGGTIFGKVNQVIAGTGGIECQSKTIGDPVSSLTNIPIMGWGSDAVTITRIYYYVDAGTIDFTLTESSSTGADPGAGGDITAETATTTLTADTTMTGDTAIAAGNKVLIDITAVTSATWLYIEVCPS